MRQQKAKKKFRPLRSLYHLLVGISAIVVLLYIAVSLAFKAPEVAQAVDTDTDTHVEYTEFVGPQRQLIRKELTYTFLLAASDDGNGNADTLMVVTYDVPNQTIGVVSIPRDTAVETDRTASPKINAAFGRGIDNLCDEVSKLVGIPIDFYIMIDMTAFTALVDSVDGVYFDVPVEMYYNDPTQDLNIFFDAGYQYLTGEEALRVCRFRSNADGTGYANSDLGRIQTQQAMIMTIAEKLISFNSVTKINEFIDIFNTYVDTNLSLSDMGYFATKALEVDLSTSVSKGTLPGDGTQTYLGFSWSYILYKEEALAMLNAYVNPYEQSLNINDVCFVDADE